MPPKKLSSKSGAVQISPFAQQDVSTLEHLWVRLGPRYPVPGCRAGQDYRCSKAPAVENRS